MASGRDKFSVLYREFRTWNEETRRRKSAAPKEINASQRSRSRAVFRKRPECPGPKKKSGIAGSYLFFGKKCAIARGESLIEGKFLAIEQWPSVPTPCPVVDKQIRRWTKRPRNDGTHRVSESRKVLTKRLKSQRKLNVFQICYRIAPFLSGLIGYHRILTGSTEFSSRIYWCCLVFTGIWPRLSGIYQSRRKRDGQPTSTSRNTLRRVETQKYPPPSNAKVETGRSCPSKLCRRNRNNQNWRRAKKSVLAWRFIGFHRICHLLSGFYWVLLGLSLVKRTVFLCLIMATIHQWLWTNVGGFQRRCVVPEVTRAAVRTPPKRRREHARPTTTITITTSWWVKTRMKWKTYITN